jgi:hypothetical protein
MESRGNLDYKCSGKNMMAMCKIYAYRPCAREKRCKGLGGVCREETTKKI